MSNVNVIHSLVDTIKNVASLAQLDFFVIFEGNTGIRRFSGSDDFVELFMRYDLLPHHTDIRLDSASSAKLKETRVGDLIPMEPDDEDDDCAVENRLVYCAKEADEENKEGKEEEEEIKPRIEDTFSVSPGSSKVTRSGRRSNPPRSLGYADFHERSKRNDSTSPLENYDSPLALPPSLKRTPLKSAKETIPPPAIPSPLFSLPSVTLGQNGKDKKMFSSPIAAAAIAAAAIDNNKRYQKAAKKSASNGKRRRRVNADRAMIGKRRAGDMTDAETRSQGRNWKPKQGPMSRCDTCGKVFFSRFNMLRHVENVHLGVLPYSCTHCGKGFPQKNSMESHVIKIHSAGKNRKRLSGELEVTQRGRASPSEDEICDKD